MQVSMCLRCLNRNILILLIVDLFLKSSPTYCASISETINFERFLELVDRKHPENRIDELNLERSVEAQKKSGILSDPEISLGREEVPTGTDMNMFMWRLSATQTFPWPGTLNAANEISEQRSKKISFNNQILTLQRRLSAEELYIQMVSSSKLIEIEKKNLQETLNILKISEDRLKYAVGSHHEFIQAKNEKTILSLNIQGMESDLYNLKDIAAQSIGEEDASNVSFKLEYSPEIFIARSRDEDLTKRLLESNQNETFAQLDFERKQSLPNFMVTGMAMRMDSGMHMYGIEAGVRLPIYSSSIRKSVNEEKVLSAQRTSDELAWYDRKKHLALVQNSRRKVIIEKNIQALRNEIVPSFEEHLKTLFIEYSQGKSSFLDVNLARKLLFKYQGVQVMAERDLALNLISKEKIQAGIVDSDSVDQAPQLPSFDIVSGMNMNKGMSGMNRPSPMKTKRQNPLEEPNDDEGEKKEKSGMDGMN
jgi:outer membrane protein TolC